MKFKKGNKVKVLDGSEIKDYTGNFIEEMKKYVGSTRTIRDVFKYGGKPAYKLDNCLYTFDERGLAPVNETIVIYRKDNETIALDKRTGKKAVAKCSPEDTYNFETGAKLAFDRLMCEPLFYPKEPFNAKIIFTKGDDIFKTGHIYEIKDGKLEHPEGNGFFLPYSKEYNYKFYSIDEVKDYFTGKAERKHRNGWSLKTLEFIEVVDDRFMRT